MKYRQNAVECYEAARTLSDHREKAKMLAMAQSWILLAALAERNCRLEGRHYRIDRAWKWTRPYAIFQAWQSIVSAIYAAMAAGVTDRLWEVSDIVALLEATEATPAKLGPYQKRAA
jgi:hypothetical protein